MGMVHFKISPLVAVLIYNLFLKSEAEIVIAY